MIRIGHELTMLRDDEPPPGSAGSGGASSDAIQRFLNGTATDADLMELISSGEITAGQAATYKASKSGGGLPGGTLPVTSDPLYYIRLPSVTPNATRFFDPVTGNFLDESGDPVTEAERKRLAGMYGGSFGGSGGGGSSRLASDDPRYWQQQQAELDLDWAKLTSDEKMQAEQIKAQLINAGLDAETARRQALASLIQSRNSNSIDLAKTGGDIAAQAAQFAANPRDAIAELQFRNATGTAPAFGAIGNAAFGGYQSKLDQKFQDMFGGVAGDLSRAREYVNSIPPTEFFGAETRQQLGLPLLPQQEMLQPQSAPNALEALTQKLQAMSAPDKEAFRRYTDPAYREQQTRIEDAYAKDPKAAEEFFRKLAEMNGGVPPTRAEDGVNMNIHEPAAIVGMSGRVYATMAENDPEQLRVIPIPSVKKARAEAEKKQKEREKSGASVRDGDPFHAARMKFLEETRGAQRMATGGDVYVNPYGPELPGYKNTRISEGYDPRTGERQARLPGHGYDIAQRIRAGKFNFAGLGSKKGGRGSGGGVSPRAGSLRNKPVPTRTSTGMPTPQGDWTNSTGSGQNNQQNPVLNDFMGNIRQQLAGLGAITPNGQGLPDPRMLANGVLSRNETDPVLQAYIEAAYSRMGIDPRTLWATAQQYRPTGLNTGGGVPSVRFV